MVDLPNISLARTAQYAVLSSTAPSPLTPSTHAKDPSTELHGIWGKPGYALTALRRIRKDVYDSFIPARRDARPLWPLRNKIGYLNGQNATSARIGYRFERPVTFEVVEMWVEKVWVYGDPVGAAVERTGGPPDLGMEGFTANGATERGVRQVTDVQPGKGSMENVVAEGAGMWWDSSMGEYRFHDEEPRPC